MSGLPKNINELVVALWALRGQVLSNNTELYDECRDVFEKIHRISDFDPNDVEKTVRFLERLPIEIRELDIEELDIGEKKTESKSLNKEDLKQLIEDYEKSQDNDVKAKISEEIYKRTGKKNVEQFIQKQKDIFAKNAEKLSKFDPDLREKIVLDLATISEGQDERIAQIIEASSLNENQSEKELLSEIKKSVKDPDEIERIFSEIKEIRAEIKVENEAIKIAQRVYEKLRDENVPVDGEIVTKIKEEILESWKESEEFKMPDKLAEKAQDETISREIVRAAESFKKNNLKSIVSYRAEELGKEIGQELRNNGVSDEKLIGKYVKAVNDLTNNPEGARQEINKSEVVESIERRHEGGYKFMTQPEIAVDEARFMAKNIVTAPKKFNRIIRNYNEARDLIGADKLPKLKEIRVTEKMMALFKNNPKVLSMLNGAQKMTGFLEKINAFPESLLAKLGAREVGMKVLERIGGQVAVDFVTNAATVIAEQGTLQGLKSIALGMLGRGTVAAGEAVGGGEALAAVIAAFQAMPVIGQILTVAVLAVAGIVMIVLPIIKKVKEVLGNILHIDMDAVKHFISDSLGMGDFVGGVGQFFFDVGTFLVGLPALLATLNFTRIVAPVVIFFSVGIGAYMLLQQNLNSSLVPPTQMGGGGCVLKETAEKEGMINCDQNAPANDFRGMVSKAVYVGVAGNWKAGKNYSEECYNDTVNRSLCAGINPAYALRTWLFESGASNYSDGKAVADFGMAAINKPKNYNAQIEAFLKLDPASVCLGTPKIGNDYWLAYATNFLTGDIGAACDPDKIASGITGRQYKKMIEDSWKMVSNEGLPGSIHVDPGGQNCGSAGGSGDTPITNEYTDENGDVWICYGDGQDGGGEVPVFDPWDPTIPVPEGCPSGRPTSGPFTQGPFASGCSHQSMSIPAVDIGTGNGTPIVATHPGVAVLNHDSVYGYYIDVHGKCEGKDFYTRYAHMPPDGFKVSNNSQVTAGQQIGVVDDTGASTGPHLHYHISGLDTNKFGQYLGLTVKQAEQLWGCCGSWNGKYCP